QQQRLPIPSPPLGDVDLLSFFLETSMDPFLVNLHGPPLGTAPPTPAALADVGNPLDSISSAWNATAASSPAELSNRPNVAPALGVWDLELLLGANASPANSPQAFPTATFAAATAAAAAAVAPTMQIRLPSSPASTPTMQRPDMFAPSPLSFSGAATASTAAVPTQVLPQPTPRPVQFRNVTVPGASGSSTSTAALRGCLRRADGTYACSCGRAPFATLGGLRAHAKLHGMGRQHACSRCPAAFRRRQDLRRHEASSHAPIGSGLEDGGGASGGSTAADRAGRGGGAVDGEWRRRFSCGKCGGRFSRSDALHRHVRTYGHFTGAAQ
ncbi:hypothetical protein HK405_002149, partial [Cladochytrium tenue]